jgi:hypothetical protein
METYWNQALQGKSLVLDESVFLNCKVIDCDVYYSGGDFEWVETQFVNCRFHLRGAAKNTIQLAQMIGMITLQAQPPIQIPPSTQKPN